MSTTPTVVVNSRYVPHDRAQTGARFKRFLNGARSAVPTVQESTRILNAIAKKSRMNNDKVACHHEEPYNGDAVFS